MACDLSTIQSEACSSGIGKQQDRIKLLQWIAQLSCEISESSGAGLFTGAIIMWSGTIASIPSGWVICDGSNGTPDLRDRFVVCARQDDAGVAKTNITGALTQSGGSITHNHGVTDPGHTHLVVGDLVLNAGDKIINSSPAGDFDEISDGTVPSNTTGLTVNNQSAPQPYFALAYIMKL